MDESDFNSLYIISYLIASSENEKIIGYSDLSARLVFLKQLVEGEDRLRDYYVEGIEDLVKIDDDNTLDWSELKDLIERATSDEHGQMFINVNSNSIGPEKWMYEFHCEAPHEILEKRLEELIGEESINRFLEKIDTAAQADDEDLLTHVYNT